MMFAGLILCFMSAGTFLLGWLTYRSQRSFEKNSVNTRAVIMGYRQEDNSSYVKPRVRFFDNGEEVLTGAQSIRSKRCPEIGTEVEIAYVAGHFMGRQTWRVRIIQNEKAGTSGYIAAVVIGVIGFGLLIIGLIVLINSFL